MAPSSQDDIPDDEDEHNDKDSLLSKLFSSCADDPKGSVHRAWGVSLIFLVVYFVLAVLESKCYSYEGFLGYIEFILDYLFN